MSNLSNYENNNNPLTEVALALAMAFFSIMILSIFALSNASMNKENQLSLNNKSKVTNLDKVKRIGIYFYQNNFYDENQKILKINQLNLKKKYLLFIPVDITIDKLFSIKASVNQRDIKVSKIPEGIINKLKFKISGRKKWDLHLHL